MSVVFRKELKFIISFLEFSTLQKRLNNFIQLDKNSIPNGYMVRSLYFDSLGDSDLHDVLLGNYEKKKIRLRIYSPFDPIVKLEYKQKYGSDCIKNSINISKANATKMIGGDYSFLRDIEDPLALKIFLELNHGFYKPKALVNYNRQAYTYDVSDVRITFDTSVSSTAFNDCFFDENPALFPLMPCDKGVLEVKYNHFLPFVLKDALSHLNLTQSSNSKYVQARLI